MNRTEQRPEPKYNKEKRLQNQADQAALQSIIDDKDRTIEAYKQENKRLKAITAASSSLSSKPELRKMALPGSVQQQPSAKRRFEEAASIADSDNKYYL